MFLALSEVGFPNLYMVLAEADWYYVVTGARKCATTFPQNPFGV